MLNHGAPALCPGVTISPLTRSERLFCPTLRARLLARWRRFHLDRELAQGCDPSASPVIAARAAQLGTPSARARIASGLERMTLRITDPPRLFAVLPSRTAVLANRCELLELAGFLRRDRPLYASGIAMLRLVLVDGTGPAYTDRHGEALARQLQMARERLGL